jgi:hypothetical protein
MSPAFYVAAILAVGWNLVLALVAYVSGAGPFRSTPLTSRILMDRVVHRVRAEVGQPHFDARQTAWKSAGVNTIEHVQTRVTETSQEVSVAVPYAETSVPVTTSEGEEQRHCSVCMN